MGAGCDICTACGHQWESEVIRLELIIIPKVLKDLKDKSHDLYDVTRETGGLVSHIMNIVGNTHIRETILPSRPSLSRASSANSLATSNSGSESDTSSKSPLLRRSQSERAAHTTNLGEIERLMATNEEFQNRVLALEKLRM